MRIGPNFMKFKEAKLTYFKLLKIYFGKIAKILYGMQDWCLIKSTAFRQPWKWFLRARFFAGGKCSTANKRHPPHWYQTLCSARLGGTGLAHFTWLIHSRQCLRCYDKDAHQKIVLLSLWYLYGYKGSRYA